MRVARNICDEKLHISTDEDLFPLDNTYILLYNYNVYFYGNIQKRDYFHTIYIPVTAYERNIERMYNNMLFNRKPKVACPKCKALHELNKESTCPICGTKYKLPDEYTAALQNDASTFSLRASSVKVINKLTCTASKIVSDFGNLKNSTKRLIKISSVLCAVFVIFIIAVLACFADKEPLLYNPGVPENQPMFYYTSDDRLCCLFPNGKNVDIGVGVLRDYASCVTGKNVYVSFSGTLGNEPASKAANYILHISKYSKINEIFSDKDYVPEFLSGGNCGYVYIMLPDGGISELSTLFLSKDGKEPQKICDSVRDLCISPNGKHAFFSVDDNGGSKLMEYSVGAEPENPGIKNAYPLSVDNKGEYLIYAKKTNAESISIVSEKSTSERLEIATIKETHLSRLIFSADKRKFAIEYDDRTTFYSCGDDYYSTVLTYNGSRFGMNISENTKQNILSLSDIPALSISNDASLLPYYFFDKEREGVYCVDKDGSKIPVFDRTFTQFKVSENGYVAFVSDGKLFCGKLNPRNNQLCEMSDFSAKTLVDISPDGKKILYNDADGNLFSIDYGVKNDTPEKLYVDADFVNFSDDGKTLLVCGDNVTSFISESKVSNLCEGIIPEETAIINGDLSVIVYAKEVYVGGEPTGEKSLCLYLDGKTRIITEKLGRLLVNDRTRVDRTLSDYTDIYAANPAK